MIKFDEDYYERGIEKGISCFENYRWLPELTIPAAMACVDYLGIERGDTVLDFGCAKGYYVKALRMLGRTAWGCDASRYAQGKCDASVKPFVKLCTEENPFPFTRSFDFIIAKDVLEHMTEQQVLDFLGHAKDNGAGILFVVVPLATLEGRYIIPEDEKDVTHIIRKTQYQWEYLLTGMTLWELVDFSFKVPGLKEHQTSRYEGGVGFFTLQPKEK